MPRKQRQIFGSSTWLRSHQLPYVSACWEHAIRLIETRAMIGPLAIKVPEKLTSSEKSSGDESWYATASRNILIGGLPSISPAQHASAWRIFASDLCGEPLSDPRSLAKGQALYEVCAAELPWHHMRGSPSVSNMLFNAKRISIDPRQTILLSRLTHAGDPVALLRQIALTPATSR